MGQLSGTETVTLTLNQMPLHTHSVVAATSATAESPSGAVYGGNSGSRLHGQRPQRADECRDDGDRRRQPAAQQYDAVSAVNFIISLEGIFPSQN